MQRICLAATLACLILRVSGAYAQTATVGSPAATFEVASVKPNSTGASNVNVDIQPSGRFTAINAPVRELIRMAYQLPELQIVGLPEWAGSTRVDVVAKTPGEN